jgi:lysosomal Pro-X carboxypeptidase
VHAVHSRAFCHSLVSYWRVVTRDATPAAGSAAACSSNVRAAWKAMFALAATPQGLQQLSDLFSTCQPLQSEDDVNLLAALYINAWDTLAMGNFPYPSNYLSGSVDLPPWPFR